MFHSVLNKSMSITFLPKQYQTLDHSTFSFIFKCMITYFKTENLERRASVFLTTKLPRKYHPINTIYKQHQRLNIVPKQNRALNIQATQHLKAYCKA